MADGVNQDSWTPDTPDNWVDPTGEFGDGDKAPKPDQPTPKVDQPDDSGPDQPQNPSKSVPDVGESADPGLPGSPGDPNRPADSPEPEAKPMISREDAAQKAVQAECNLRSCVGP
jgi:hypothetical protein